MKKVLIILLILFIASSAWATIYRWVDKAGVVNFADDYSKVPPDYRDKVEEMSIAKMGPSTTPPTPLGTTNVRAQSAQQMAKQPPPIEQTLVREGDLALKLAEALKIGRAESEAEAENLLASVGIAPKNGWIADYPVTPDIVGELEKAVSEAGDNKRLPMDRNEALKVFRTTAVEFELPIIAEVPQGYPESPPPTTPEYTEPSAIDNYYSAEGPPVVTYYPPPWDYSYMYAWIPYPFWWSGFYFPGFYVLHDFHRVCHGHGHGHGHWDGHDRIVSNHTRDPRTGKIFTIDPARRNSGKMSAGTGSSPARGFNSTETKNSAQSILERSRGRTGSGGASMPTTSKGTNNRTPAYANPGRGNEKQVYNKRDMSSGFNGRNSIYDRPPTVDRRTSRIPGQTFSQGMNNRPLSRPQSMNRQYGMNSQRPFAGETRSFSPPSRGTERSFSPSPQAGGQHFGSPRMGGGGFSGSHQGGGFGGGLGHGGSRF